MSWFEDDDLERRVQHALRVEKVMVRLGYFVAIVGVISIGLVGLQLLLGTITLNNALIVAFGVLNATVLTGGAAYAAGTNLGLNAAKIRRDLEAGS